jgi:hypothetical protein
MSTTTRRFNILAIAISGISALVAAISVYFTYGQLAVAVNQQKAATSQQIAATRLEDLRFVGRIAVELDEPDHKIRIFNYSDLPLADAALWTLGLVKNMDGSEKLDTIRIPLTGLGACRTMTFLVSTLIRAAVEFARLNLGKVGPPPESATEPYLTFRAPLGSWYTVSETAVYPADDHDYSNNVNAAISSEPEDSLADSVLEGVDEERTVDVIQPIGPAAPVTQFTTGGVDVTSNGCAGPVK